MHCFALQSFTNLRTAGGASTKNQSEHAWLDLAGYRDVTAWVEITEITVNATKFNLNVQSSPNKDDALFQTVATVDLTTAAPGVTVLPVHIDTAQVPLARWVRWQLFASGASGRQDVTFRIWLAAAGAPGISGASG